MSFSAAVFPTANATAPVKNNDDGSLSPGIPKFARVSVEIPASGSITLNLSDVITSEQIDQIQTVWVDNRAGANPFTVTSSVLQIVRSVPAGAQALLPFFVVPGDTRFTFSRADAGTVVVGFLNVPLPSDQGGGNGIVVYDPTIADLLTPPNIATRTSVAAAAVDTLILAANASRKGASIFNDSASATLYLALGTAAATIADYTVKILPGQFYETLAGYTGQIRGIWSAAVGAAKVTEQT